MKTVKLSLSLRTTSDIFASSTRKASATFCSTVISLFLSSHSIREASISFLIGRAQSRDIAQCRETTRTFALLYNPAKCRHCITLKRIPKKDVLNENQPASHRLSEIPPNQPSTSESARSQRISQTHRIGSTPGIRQIPAHGFSRTSHRPPQPATARGSQPGRGLIVKGLLGLIRVRGVPVYGPRALFYTRCSLAILCPFCGLLVYGHRPFDLAHGLFSLRLRALRLKPTGPRFIPAGPCPNCYLVD